MQRIKSVDVGVSGNDPAGEEASELGESDWTVGTLTAEKAKQKLHEGSVLCAKGWLRATGHTD